MEDELHIFTDGASRGNPGKAAIAFSIYRKDGSVLKEHKECIGETTNNMAEYTAIIKALGFAAGKCRKVVLTSDSELVIRQLKGEYRVREERLQELNRKVRQLEKAFESVKYSNKPRTFPQIKKVDALANYALDGC